MIRRFTKTFEKIIFSSESLVNLYGLYYKNTVAKEIDLANIKKEDRVLIVGGGSVPSTAILIGRTTKAKVDVIDLDEEAVKKSKDLIKRMNLEDSISVYLKDALKVTCKDYDVIHLALQVSPKEEVISCIWKTAKDGSRMIVRQPKKLLRNFYSNISKDFLRDEEIKFEVSSRRNSYTTMDNVLLLIKE